MPRLQNKQIEYVPSDAADWVAPLPADPGSALDDLADRTSAVETNYAEAPLGTTLDHGLVRFAGIGGKTIEGVGVRHYGSMLVDPVPNPGIVPPPDPGDMYYNTSIEQLMTYEGNRSKWLSVATADLVFGRYGRTGSGAYYRGPGNRSYGDSVGRAAEYDGTVVSMSYTRSGVALARFAVTANGVILQFLNSSATSGISTTFDADFSAGQILGIQSSPGSATTRNVAGCARIRWRSP